MNMQSYIVFYATFVSSGILLASTPPAAQPRRMAPKPAPIMRGQIVPPKTIASPVTKATPPAKATAKVAQAAAAAAPVADKNNYNSNYLKEWINGPNMIPGAPVPNNIIDKGSTPQAAAQYASYKNENDMYQKARQLHARTLTLSDALKGLSDADRANLAHVYRVAFNADLWTDSTIIK